MSELLFRKAVLGDADQLADLAHEMNLFHDDDTRPSPELLRKHWGFYDVYVVDRRGQGFVGYAAGYSMFQFHTATPGFEIQNIAVTKRFRRAGIGRKLMEGVILEKYAVGIRKFTLGVECKNESARAFYKSMGFVDRDFGLAKRCYLRDADLEKFIEKLQAR
jgi:ribosomal protein S18 acetylase RimI-like enzyme